MLAGWQAAAGAVTGWVPVSRLSMLWRWFCFLYLIALADLVCSATAVVVFVVC